uniref:Uncharacterized protein n=1 Tax=Chromera velia CCMP2878 TaxID=1169474 RepID=A0A0G4ICK6_9ALVE|eukprot:Cvel_2280.t1-p1 / transcript=Cvel_2280.t1 / gene=Cvel_2280 / organism=Chromera_velia_CCMP2878 / gene_product=hypothetical protein / transcript_product=hypothetical protein / location=Cvel_scaffold88:70467-70808(-) / protein_length=114 / sequence_SO=supercontig / SO=protein_coding / is_pseudo=false
MGKGKGKKKEKEKEKKTAEGKAGEQSLQSLREIILQMHESFHEDKWAELKEKAVSKLLPLSPCDPVGLRVHAETTVQAFEKANQAVERLNRNDPSDPESKQRSLDELAESHTVG